MLLKRDDALNAGAEIPQPLVHSSAAGHVADFDTARLGEHCVLDLFAVDRLQFQVVAGGEGGIEGGATGRPRYAVSASNLRAKAPEGL